MIDNASLINFTATSPAIGYKLRVVREHVHDWAHIFHTADGWKIAHGKGEAAQIADPLPTVRAWAANGLTVSFWHCTGLNCFTPEVKADILAFSNAGGNVTSGICAGCKRAFLSGRK